MIGIVQIKRIIQLMIIVMCTLFLLTGKARAAVDVHNEIPTVVMQESLSRFSLKANH